MLQNVIRILEIEKKKKKRKFSNEKVSTLLYFASRFVTANKNEVVTGLESQYFVVDLVAFSMGKWRIEPCGIIWCLKWPNSRKTKSETEYN